MGREHAILLIFILACSIPWHTPCSFAADMTLLVNFGATESDDQFGIAEWNTVIKDNYTGNIAYGPDGVTIISGSNKDYNYQGVSGTTRSFSAEESIVVTWYNHSDQQITFSPKISFTDDDRPGGTGWFSMTETVLGAFSHAQSVYTFDGSSSGDYTLVNVTVNHENNKTVLCDKIELAATGFTLDSTAPAPVVGLSGSALSENRISLTWTASSDDTGVAGYRVIRDGSPIGFSLNTAYEDWYLSVGTNYSYQVVAFDEAGNESSPSNPANTSTLRMPDLTWQTTLAQHFDHVDTFDHYKDWRPIPGSPESPSYLETGAPSWWGPFNQMYGSFPNHLPEEIPWSLTHWDSDKKVGTKSLVLGGGGINKQPTYTGHGGPSLACIYFGDPNNTDGSTGYEEIHIFFRVYLASNSVPTDQEVPDTKIYKYVPGHEYLETRGHKMVLPGNGFVATNAYHDAVNDRVIEASNSEYYKYRYGDSGNWVYLNSTNDTNGENRDLKMNITFRAAYDNAAELDYPDDRAWSEIADQLGAVEIHARLEPNPSSSLEGHTGLFEVWTYDQNGQCQHYDSNNECIPEIRKETASFKSLSEQKSHKFNRLCFDGNFRVHHDCGTPCESNKDVYFTAGAGLEVGWWIDDLILDDERIGPTYFSLLNSQPATPAPPADLRIIQ